MKVKIIKIYDSQVDPTEKLENEFNTWASGFPFLRIHKVHYARTRTENSIGQKIFELTAFVFYTENRPGGTISKWKGGEKR